MNTNTDNTMQDTQLDGMYRMASKFLGYTGPKTKEALEQFRQSSPAVAAKMKRYNNAMAKGGLMRKGYDKGGPVLASDPSNAPGYQDFINSPEYQEAYNSPSLAVMNPVTVGDQAYNFSGSMGDAYRQFIARTQGQQQQPASTGPTPFVTPSGTTTTSTADTVNPTTADLAQAQQDVVMQTMTPYRPEVTPLQETTGQIVDVAAGQAAGAAPQAQVAVAPIAAQGIAPAPTPSAQAEVSTVAPEVSATLAGVEAATGQVSPQAQVAAATQATTSVANLEAAQGTAIMMDNPVQREIQDGELISGAADAAKAAAFTEQIEAATATPSKKATVAGQLEGLMAEFEGGNTPAWAAGAMRTAMQTLSARGLGASSMAGQAVVQAAMEASLPIAAADAQTVAQFEVQNLSNKQQRAMLAAQQRATFMGMEFDQAFQARVANASKVSDIANMNFTAEQQVALENSRAANTMNLQNLTNRQAKVMAEAAALANLDMANLNNRQQAAVQNAQSFLQMDLTNLSNEQQTNMFKAQQNIQSLFTDQAAENAAAQFNAANENQTNQFFAELATQTSQFNASQANAMTQFNVDAVNSINQFNAEQQQQRDLFNAQNSLIIEQANAQWRQSLATFNTAAQNEANMTLAQTLNNLTMSNVDKIWQRERDLMTFAIQTANSNADRATQIAIQKLANEAAKDAAATSSEGSKSAAFASAAGSIVSKIIEFW